MTKKRVTKPKASPSPKEIVDAWHARIVARLKPLSLEARCFKVLEPKLRKNIAGLLKSGLVFTALDKSNSLRVAGDAARICKILQPAGHDRVVRFDTFQAVLNLCATNHQVCQIKASGAGGWCNIGH